MRSLIVGTAGHIDHGKTTLVRALTGVDTDRLPEEKRRGITIDLGFAQMTLGDTQIGLIDVPGHERFVKNMLAGAHGIDLVLLVVAADEGVMPQTREHFEVCRLLGVKSGIIVLTKSDAADPELLPLVRAEARELTRASFLENAPLIEISVRANVGLDELRAALAVAADNLPARGDRENVLARLSIDRAFSMRGFGTVVTGTLIAGRIAAGEELELLPGGARVRVRGVQVHNRDAEAAEAGQRAALNLGGVDASSVERGMVLAPPGRLRPAQNIDARLELLSDAARPLRSRARVRVHAGTSEVLARVQVLEESGEIAPGGSGLVQMRCESTLIAVTGDRLIVRAYSPARTVGGAVVIDALAERHRGAKEKDAARARLAAMRVAAEEGAPARLLEAIVGGAADKRVTSFADVIARTNWGDEALRSAIENAANVIEVGRFLVARSAFESLARLSVEAVKDFHHEEPLAAGLSRETLREQVFSAVPPEIFRAVLAKAEAAGTLVAERELVRAREHKIDLSGADAALRERLDHIYREAGLSVPTTEEALARAAREVSDAVPAAAKSGAGKAAADAQRARQILQLLVSAGALVRVGDLVFHRQALDDLSRRLRAHAAAGDKSRSIDVAAFKDLAGVTRRHAIPLLEHLDRTRVTRREGDRRVIL